MSTLEPIFVVGNTETVAAIQKQALAKGIKPGDSPDWVRIRNVVKELEAIEHKEELLIHLRILADHYLPMKLGEANRPDWHAKIKAIADLRKDAKKRIKELELALALNTPSQGFGLKQWLISNELRVRLAAVLDDARHELDNPHPNGEVPEGGFSRTITDYSKHALVNTFAALWDMYSRRKRKGKMELARLFFIFAGYQATGIKAELNDRDEEQAMRDLFRDAKEKGGHLGLLTTVRRLTPEEIGALKINFSKSKPTF